MIQLQITVPGLNSMPITVMVQNKDIANGVITKAARESIELAINNRRWSVRGKQFRVIIAGTQDDIGSVVKKASKFHFTEKKLKLPNFRY